MMLMLTSFMRLRSSIDGGGDGSVDVDTHVMKGISSIIGSGESVAEKQRRFDAMILQIQTLKETLGRENDLKVGAKSLPLTHVTSFVSSCMLPLNCYTWWRALIHLCAILPIQWRRVFVAPLGV